jgi:predicted naringenin-chalcone synthase
LDRNEIDIHNIQWWVVHAAGSSVLDNIRDTLEIPEEKLNLSRETLKNFGNTSSTSVGLTGKSLMSQDIKQGDYAMMVSVGPGMTGGATILKFE